MEHNVAEARYGGPDAVTEPLLAREPEGETASALPAWATSSSQWKLIKVENGLRVFQEASSDRKRGRGCLCCRSGGCRLLKAVAVVKSDVQAASDLLMGLGSERGQWDPLFEKGRVVHKLDERTDIVQKCFRGSSSKARKQDFCLLRSWARPSDIQTVISYRSTQHKKCPQQSEYLRAQMKSGGYNLTQLRSGPNPQTLLEHVVELEEGTWLFGPRLEIVEACQLLLLNRIAGLREYVSALPSSPSLSPIRTRMTPQRLQRNRDMDVSLESQMSDEGDFFDAKQDNLSETASEAGSPSATRLGLATPAPLPSFDGSVRKSLDGVKDHDCWSVPDPAGFSVRSKSFPFDKALEPAQEPVFTLVAVDWFKSDARMDRLARRPGGLVNRTLKGGPPFMLVVNMQVPAGSVHYSMVYYFASHRPISERMLFHRFMHADDAYRDAHLTLLPRVPEGSWVIRQAVGSRPVPLAQVLKCRYDKGEHFFEIDVDMGTSPIVRYVLSLVLPVVTVLVVDMAFLVKGETEEELPEVLLGAVRLHTLELTSAIPPPPENEADRIQ